MSDYSWILTTTARILFYNNWKENYRKLQMNSVFTILNDDVTVREGEVVTHDVYHVEGSLGSRTTELRGDVADVSGAGLGRVTIEHRLLHCLPYHSHVVTLDGVDRVPRRVGEWFPLG